MNTEKTAAKSVETAAVSSTPDQQRFERFIEALRAWGDSTIEDRARQEAELMEFVDLASQFSGEYGELYRGDELDDSEFETVVSKQPLTKLLAGRLLSFSRTEAGARTFAEFSNTGRGVLYRKSGFRAFLDFDALAGKLKDIGFPIQRDEDDYTLSDPIKEHEVICHVEATLTIFPEDMIEVWGFTEDDEPMSLRRSDLEPASESRDREASAH